MLQYRFEFKDEQNNNMSCTKKTVIWNNQDIKIILMLTRRFFSALGLINSLDQNLDFLTDEEFRLAQISVVNNFFDLFRLIIAIPQEYKKQLKKQVYIKSILQNHGRTWKC